MHYVTKEIFVSQDSETVRKIGATSVVLNLGGGTESHEFHTCIHRTLRRWKNKMCVVNFIFFTLIVKNLQVTNHCCSTIIISSYKKISILLYNLSISYSIYLVIYFQKIFYLKLSYHYVPNNC